MRKDYDQNKINVPLNSLNTELRGTVTVKLSNYLNRIGVKHFVTGSCSVVIDTPLSAIQIDKVNGYIAGIIDGVLLE